MGELPRPAEKRSMAVRLAKVPLVVLSFALVSVFLVGDIKHEGRKKRASHVSEGDGRGGYGVGGVDGNVRWNSCRGEIEHGTQGYLGES